MKLFSIFGVLIFRTMKEHSNHYSVDSEKDALWNLLAEDAKIHPIHESPWFATRTKAKALETTQRKGFFAGLTIGLPSLRWLMPIPLAGVVAVTLLLMQHSSFSSHTRAFSSSESEFEQHMEMFSSNNYTQ